MSVGKPLHHESAHQHVQGAAPYVDDLPEPAGMLHGALGLGPAKVGQLKSVNVDAIRQTPGVVAVYTADDFTGENDAGPVVHDDPVLAEGQMRYPQQPVCFVVASSREIARRAARLVQVDVEARDPIVTLDQAMSAGSRLHEDLVIATGDAEATIGAAPNQLAARMRIGGQDHMYLEGQIAAAYPSPDGLHVISSTQHPTELQELIGKALVLPSAQITVEVRRMGGAFGGKETQAAAPAVLAALAAQDLGRPIKLRLDRDDDMITTGKRHDFLAEMRVGFDDQGLVQGVEHQLSSRCGHSHDLSRSINDRAAFHCDNAYFYPALKIESRRYRTDTVSNTAFRGFGGPQGMIAAERLMDKIAASVGRDPLDVRIDNMYGQRGTLAPYGMHVDEGVLLPLIKQLEASSDYRARHRSVETHNANGPRIRRGIALTPVKFGISFTASFLNQAGALVHVYKDGTVQVNHGGTEMGQGLYTKMVAIVAEVFGITPDAIRATATRTDKVPNTSPTAASSGSDLNGMAVKIACETIKSRLSAFLAQKFECEADTEFADGTVKIAGQELSFANVAQQAWFNQISLSATGYYATPGIGWDQATGKGRPFFYFANGAACSEVEIDTLTGENRVLRVDILHDVGKSLNPEIDLGQIEGGFVQGQGWLTMEELVYDDGGRLRTHAPSTYKIPTATDRPDVMNIALFDNENPEASIYRSKAVGEPPLMLPISVHCALAHAISGLYPAGEWPDLDAPATAEEVLRCIMAASDLA